MILEKHAENLSFRLFCHLILALQTLSAADLRDPEISALIAAKMREFHYLDMPGSKNVVLWNRMRCPAALLRKEFEFED